MKLFERVVKKYNVKLVKPANVAANAEGYQKFVHTSVRRDGKGNSEYFMLDLRDPNAKASLGSQRKETTFLVYVDEFIGELIQECFADGTVDEETGKMQSSMDGSIHTAALPEPYYILNMKDKKTGQPIPKEQAITREVRIFVLEDSDVSTEIKKAIERVEAQSHGNNPRYEKVFKSEPIEDHNPNSPQ